MRPLLAHRTNDTARVAWFAKRSEATTRNVLELPSMTLWLGLLPSTQPPPSEWQE